MASHLQVLGNLTHLQLELLVPTPCSDVRNFPARGRKSVLSRRRRVKGCSNIAGTNRIKEDLILRAEASCSFIRCCL
uniref:Uncharacterized protein n=1 Tax=Utricularia reniformis TaxID=192314 RepID=A0A1Y0AYT5_9LAMI|nr:hypothetical protein AEK19_MT0781 [Utricularia reniformis]ART30311.1 hypothetical protein AEK19_MT0781 [Utricularia reniformis]